MWRWWSLSDGSAWGSWSRWHSPEPCPPPASSCGRQGANAPAASQPAEQKQDTTLLTSYLPYSAKKNQKVSTGFALVDLSLKKSPSHSKNGFLRIIHVSSSRWNEMRKVQVWLFCSALRDDKPRWRPLYRYRCPTDTLCTQGCRKPSPLLQSFHSLSRAEPILLSDYKKFAHATGRCKCPKTHDA